MQESLNNPLWFKSSTFSKRGGAEHVLKESSLGTANKFEMCVEHLGLFGVLDAINDECLDKPDVKEFFD